MRVASILLCVLSFAAIAHAQSPGGGGRAPSSAFDGSWIVTVSCDNARDGALGYNWDFPATVQQGRLHGIHGTLGQPDSFELTGTINPDGKAQFFGKGLTGRSAYNVGRVAAGAVYAYHANGTFTSNHGQARRIELRPCTLDFSKR